MIRADIDALPMSEENDLEYKSQVEGKIMPVDMMYIQCFIRSDKDIISIKDELDGNVKLCFNNRKISGADLMVEMEY